MVKNPSGEFVEPTLETVTAAAAGTQLPDTTDFRVSITNAPGQNAYPIASYTWLLIPKTPRDSAKHRALTSFVQWAIGSEAQRMAADLHYAPLPMPVIEKVKARLTQP
jgi:phosphate transport system substrate-binding protein